MTENHRKSRGLSVIEALLAIAILGFTFSALMTLRQSALRQQQQLAVEQRIVTAHRNALALLSSLNPMTMPAGALELTPGQTVTWHATALSRSQRSRAYPAGEGAFNVVLFRLDIRVDGAASEPIEFSVERLGWTSAEDGEGRRATRS